MKALLVVQGSSWRQETYESASGDARRRAAELRQLGYRVSVSSMGPQVTPWGVVKLSLLTIHNPDDEIPEIEELRRG